MHKVLVSVVLFKNRPEQIASLIKSLSGCRGVELKLVFVDNSPDNRLCSHIPSHMIYHFVGRNLGFGKAHNLAFQQYTSDADFFLVLNPDVELEPNTLSKLTQFMSNNPKVGLCAPLVRNVDGTVQNSYKLLPSPLDLILRRFLPDSEWSKIRNRRYELSDLKLDNPVAVPVLSGCFLLFKSFVFERLNGFDPRFFMYVEDVDICRRARHFGSVVLFPNCHITHEHQKGSFKNFRLLSYHCRSALQYFFKWGWFFDLHRQKINEQALSYEFFPTSQSSPQPNPQVP